MFKNNIWSLLISLYTALLQAITCAHDDIAILLIKNKKTDVNKRGAYLCYSLFDSTIFHFNTVFGVYLNYL